jgi:hypothetical protein
MITRTKSVTLTFKYPFSLKGVDRRLTAGQYEMVSDEELIEELSFPVYRRVSTGSCRPCGGSEARSGSINGRDEIVLVYVVQPGRCPLWVISGHVQRTSKCPLCARSRHCAAPHFKTGGSETRAQRTKCDIAFAETTGRCAASAMAMPRPLAMQA